MTSFSSLALCLVLCCIALASSAKPNIVFILADDFGWANLGYHRRNDASEQAKKEVYSPNLDNLIDEGIYLSRHYAYKICSPSRSSLQSGRLAIHVNTRNVSPIVRNPEDPVSGYAGIPRNMTGMAEKLKAGGYTTAMVGKWDAGMATPEHTPYGRGYDYWYGYFHHANNYWTKGLDLQSVGEVDACLNHFTDLSTLSAEYRGGVMDRVARSDKCKTSVDEDPVCYEEHLFTEAGLNVIRKHDFSESPLFYLHAFHLVHTPLEVPIAYLKAADERILPYKFDNSGRRSYSAMVHYMDDVVDKLVDALKMKGVWDNTLIVFSSDNGGPVYDPGSANNFPLKGGKYSDWEGGVRTNAFLSGGYIPSSLRGTTYNGILSIADWYGAFAELAGVEIEDSKAKTANGWLEEHGLPLLPPVDSVSGVIDTILSGSQKNLRPVLHLSELAILQWPYKLVTGSQPYSDWLGELYPNCSSSSKRPYFVDFKILGATIPVVEGNETIEATWEQDCKDGCLFNLAKDPLETNDLSSDPDFQVKKQELASLLAEMNKSVFSPERGDMQQAACMVGLTKTGVYGPFYEVDEFYTGPVPEKSILQKAKDLAYKAELRILESDVAYDMVIKFVKETMPVVGPILMKNLDTCNGESSDEDVLGNVVSDALAKVKRIVTGAKVEM